ncbi:hypothetical protein SLS62_007508 [Diatrype stigma]|uniref:Uncharacterized protein n=1 Tax=Diatrype stigma TaxID=117547 RepID=A0AAN9UNQ4_9PEZI
MAANMTACLPFNDIDEDDPVPQFTKKLADLVDGGDVSLPSDTISDLITISAGLHLHVFPVAVPASFLITFLLSAILFWILVIMTGRSKAYKITFAVTTLMNSYGLTLGFMMAYATRLACQGLILPASGDTGQLQPDVYITRGSTLQTLQWSVVAFSCLLQLSIASLFVRRHVAVSGGKGGGGRGGGVEGGSASGHDNIQITIMPAFKKKRCCF